jgi:Cell wall synthesis protein CwsA
MGAKNHIRLTPRERLSRGLAYTAVGPVDVTRGVVGLSVHSAQAGASSLRRRYQEGRLARDIRSAQEALVHELAAAQEVVTGLPEALAQARRSQRRKPRPWVLTGEARDAELEGFIRLERSDLCDVRLESAAETESYNLSRRWYAVTYLADDGSGGEGGELWSLGESNS